MTEDTGNTTEGEHSDSFRPPQRLADDEFYRAMAAAPRRRLLYYLLEDGDHSVEELATVLTGRESTEESTMATPENRDRWMMALRHQHLPMLAEVDLLDYDPDSGRIEAVPLEERVADIVRWSVVAESGAPGQSGSRG